MKLDLFGVEKLVMHITQDDLNADDMDVLRSCSGRFLETRDRSGRIVNLVVTVPKIFKTDACVSSNTVYSGCLLQIV